MGAVRGMLLRRSRAGGGGLLYVAELKEDGATVDKMDHLVCFLPGARPSAVH